MSDTTEPSKKTSAMPNEPSGWKRVRVWGERALTVGLLAFVLYRLGPQLGALTGVGPDLGLAPDYAFVTLDGTSVTSADLLGNVVVLNFWATWCGPCKLEMPALQSLHEDRAEEGVVVLGLSTDVGGAGTISEFLSERGITYKVGRASRAHRQAFLRLLQGDNVRYYAANDNRRAPQGDCIISIAVTLKKCARHGLGAGTRQQP